MLGRARSPWLIAAPALALACTPSAYFDCSDDTQCDLAGISGVCVAGECAYADMACASGLAYSDYARPPLAGQCVDESGSSTVGPTNTGTSMGPSGTSDASGSTSESDTDTDTGDLPARCRVEEVDGGKDHTCLLTADGDVWCWGANDEQQLGVDGSGGPSPVMVEALDDIEIDALSVNGDHACALTDEDVVWCWGYQMNGEVLGADDPGVYPPTLITNLVNVNQIATADFSNCAVLGPSLSCWGDTNHHQTGQTMGKDFHTQLSGLRDGLVAGGVTHHCAQTTRADFDGVECWGDNETGQLGGGEAVGPLSAMPVVVMGLGGPARALALGEGHSCALVGTQTYCWGSDGSMELLGAGSSTTAIALTDVPPADDLRSGDRHICAQTGDDWVCWGDNGQGQIDPSGGDEVSTPLSTGDAIAGVVGLTPSFERLGLGEAHTCGFDPELGVVCWGRNDAGGLGEQWLVPGLGLTVIPQCPSSAM